MVFILVKITLLICIIQLLLSSVALKKNYCRLEKIVETYEGILFKFKSCLQQYSVSEKKIFFIFQKAKYNAHFIRIRFFIIFLSLHLYLLTCIYLVLFIKYKLSFPSIEGRYIKKQKFSTLSTTSNTHKIWQIVEFLHNLRGCPVFKHLLFPYTKYLFKQIDLYNLQVFKFIWPLRGS